MPSIRLGEMPTRIEVGTPFFGEAESCQPGAYWNWQQGNHMFLIFWDHITPAEAQAIRQGALELALIVDGDVIWLLVRPYFVKSEREPLDWVVCPYSWHVMTPEMQARGLPADPTTLPQKQGDRLTLVLVECQAGMTKGIRQIGLPHDFTCFLYEAIRAQAARPDTPESYGRQVDETYERFRDLGDMLHLAQAWCMIESPLDTVSLTRRREREVQQRVVTYLRSKTQSMRDRLPLAQALGDTKEEIELGDKLWRYEIQRATRWYLRPSATAMLTHLLETQAEQHLSSAASQVTFQPGEHIWMHFEQPLLTPYGPVGNCFLQVRGDQQEYRVFAEHLPPARREAFWNYVRREAKEKRATRALELISPTGDHCIALFLNDPDGTGEWVHYFIEDCPVYLCGAGTIGDKRLLCPHCAAMEGLLPRLLILLRAMIDGYFREVIEVKAETVTEVRSVPAPGGKQKRVETQRTLQVIDVSRVTRHITEHEQAEMARPQISHWLAGRQPLTLDQIDWSNPPGEDTPVLAETRVKAHERTYKAERYKASGLLNQTRQINAYDRPRQAMSFRLYKERLLKGLTITASQYEKR